MSTNESGFKIERRSGAASYVEIARVGKNIQTYSDKTAAAGKNYCYRIRSFNAGGVSAPTNAACATTPRVSTASGSSSGENSSSTPSSPTTPPSSPPRPVAGASSGSGWKDYEVSLTMRSTDNDTLGVMFRYQDADNYYRFSWSAENKDRRLEKRVGGVFRALAQDNAAYTKGQSYDLQITADGSSLVVAIDGKTIFSVTDTSLLQGTIALYSYRNSGSYFDNIHVQDLTGNTLASDDFKDAGHVGWTIIDEGDGSTSSKWMMNQGALVQSSNIGSDNDDEKLGTYALYTRGSWTDYRMTLKMRSSDNDRVGVLFRFKDNNNHYRFLWNNENGGRRLLKKVNGKFETLAQDAVPYVSNRTYNLEIVAQGKTLKINVDGRAVFAVTDSSFGTGSVALYTSNNQGGQFDDVFVEDLKTKAVLLDYDFSSSKLTGWSAFDEPGAAQGPSKWSVASGMLIQTSNIGSDATGFPGTFFLYY
jgi:hypothetical protein